MKITIDLADVHFQTSVTKAVEAKIAELCNAYDTDKSLAFIARHTTATRTRICDEKPVG